MCAQEKHSCYKSGAWQQTSLPRQLSPSRSRVVSEIMIFSAKSQSFQVKAYMLAPLVNRIAVEPPSCYVKAVRVYSASLKSASLETARAMSRSYDTRVGRALFASNVYLLRFDLVRRSKRCGRTMNMIEKHYRLAPVFFLYVSVHRQVNWMEFAVSAILAPEYSADRK